MDDTSLPPADDHSQRMSSEEYSAHMARQSGAKTAKILGILSVIYACLGLVMAACCGVSAASLEAVVESTITQIQTGQQRMKQVYEQEVAEMEAQINAAADEEEKNELQKSRDAMIKQQPEVEEPPNLDEISAAITSPRLIKFSAIEIISGLLLNLLMLVTGVGLIQRKSWGRQGTLYVSVLKIVRLLLLYLPFLFIIWPNWVRELSAAVEKVVVETQKNNPTPAPLPPGVPGPQQMAQQLSLTVYIYGVMWAALMIVVTPIFPAILLWLLRRPHVVAACEGSTQPLATA